MYIPPYPPWAYSRYTSSLPTTPWVYLPPLPHPGYTRPHTVFSGIPALTPSSVVYPPLTHPVVYPPLTHPVVYLPVIHLRVYYSPVIHLRVYYSPVLIPQGVYPAGSHTSGCVSRLLYTSGYIPPVIHLRYIPPVLIIPGYSRLFSSSRVIPACYTPWVIPACYTPGWVIPVQVSTRVLFPFRYQPGCYSSVHGPTAGAMREGEQLCADCSPSMPDSY